MRDLRLEVFPNAAHRGRVRFSVTAGIGFPRPLLRQSSTNSTAHSADSSLPGARYTRTFSPSHVIHHTASTASRTERGTREQTASFLSRRRSPRCSASSTRGCRSASASLTCGTAEVSSPSPVSGRPFRSPLRHLLLPPRLASYCRPRRSRTTPSSVSSTIRSTAHRTNRLTCSSSPTPSPARSALLCSRVICDGGTSFIGRPVLLSTRQPEAMRLGLGGSPLPAYSKMRTSPKDCSHR